MNQPDTPTASAALDGQTVHFLPETGIVVSAPTHHELDLSDVYNSLSDAEKIEFIRELRKICSEDQQPGTERG